MTENATETKTYTAEELKAMWEALPKDFQDAVTKVNDQIDEHNRNVSLIKASKETDTVKLLSEIREQNPENDPELEKFNAEITKLNERIEALVAKGNKVAEKYLPKSITEDEVTAATEATRKSSSAIKDSVKSLETFESLMPTLVLTPHIKEAQSTRGLALIGSRGGSGETWRPRMRAIYLNGDLVQRDVQGPDGTKKPKSTLNILASELNKRLETKEYSTVGLQEAYLNAIIAAGGSKDNVPDEVEFTIKHKYQSESGEQTLEMPVKVVK
jgi:hypothetical protein